MKNFVILLMGLIIFGGSISMADIIVYDGEYKCEGVFHVWDEERGVNGLGEKLWDEMSNRGSLAYCINIDGSFKSALDMAYHFGLTKYQTSILFKPKQNITREQIAKMLFRIKISYGYGRDLSESISYVMRDEEDVDHTLSGYVEKILQAGIIKGRDNKFHPKNNVTYAQAITMLGRIVADDDGFERYDNMRWRGYEDYAIKQGYLKEYYKNPHNPISRGEFIQLAYNMLLSRYNVFDD